MISPQEAYEYLYNLLELSGDLKWPLCIDSMQIFKELVDKEKDKEIAKKPVKGKIIYNSFENIQTYHCSCGRELSFADNYCGKCGTKIDWNEVKNNG
jgi:hypothetical protein